MRSLVLLFFLLSTSVLWSQKDSITLRSFGATTPVADSLIPTSKVIAYSPDSLDAPVDYSARDSMRNDIEEEKIYLWGEAKIVFSTFELTADYIVVDMKHKEAEAIGTQDSLGRWVGKPYFKDGDQEIDAFRLRYNFETKKGIIYEAYTSPTNDIYVLSEKAKYIGTTSQTDTSEHVGHSHSGSNQVFSASNSLLTSCNHPEPHFGLRATKMKLIPEKVAVFGPANLEIAGTPTPIWLPFGFYPLKKGRSSGLIWGDYITSRELGFGLRNFGWYFPINQHWNLIMRGDIYLRGSFVVGAVANYNKRYAYSGGFDLNYASNKIENLEDGSFSRTPSLSIKWNHNQDSKAHPYRQFSGSVNIVTNGFNQTIRTDYNSRFNNQLNSNVNFNYKFPNSPFSLSSSFAHTQNTQTRKINFTFPTLNLQMQQIYPFKRKKPIGNERWYEKASLSYNFQFRNVISAVDSAIFTDKTLNDMRTGAQHQATMNVPFDLLKYFKLNISANYTEVWNFQYLRKTFDPTLTIVQDTVRDPITNIITRIDQDTTVYGQVIDNTSWGFRPARNLSASASINTQIFGTLLFKKGLLRGLRHRMQPSASASFSPNYNNRFWGQRFQTLDVVTLRPGQNKPLTYSELGLTGTPFSVNLTSKEAFSIGYSLNNSFEGKYFSKRDSTVKKFTLLDNLVFNGSYNPLLDSLKWGTINMSTNVRMPGQIGAINISAAWDPYTLRQNENGSWTRVNQFYYKDKGKLLRFNGAMANFSTGARVSQILQFFKGQDVASSEADEKKKNPNALRKIDVLINEFSLSYNIGATWQVVGFKDTLYLSTHGISLRGSIPISDKWSINLNNIAYDFRSGEIVYPDLGISRDLHCWEMGLQWQPQAGTYFFFIRVKPGTFDFLKWDYRKIPQDAFR